MVAFAGNRTIGDYRRTLRRVALAWFEKLARAQMVRWRSEPWEQQMIVVLPPGPWFLMRILPRAEFANVEKLIARPPKKDRLCSKNCP